MSYNIKSLSMDPAALCAVIRRYRPDVLAVQEPPRFVGARARLRALAHAAGLEVVVYGNYPFGGATTALLASPEFASQVVRRGSRILPLDVWRWRGVWRERRIWPTRRGFSFFETADAAFFSVHLGLNDSERETHRNIMLHQISAFGPERCVVAGDLNERPDGPSWRSLARRLTDVGGKILADDPLASINTFPSQRPRLRIDAVFTGADFELTHLEVPHDMTASRASDHLPVVADLSRLARR